MKRSQARSAAFRWSNGPGGALEVTQPSPHRLESLPELAQYVWANYAAFNDRHLQLLGARVVFFAIRESGHGDYAMYHAEKALDAFYLVLPSPTAQSALEQGMESLRDHIFRVRAEELHVIVSKAFDFIEEGFAALP